MRNRPANTSPGVSRSRGFAPVRRGSTNGGLDKKLPKRLRTPSSRCTSARTISSCSFCSRKEARCAGLHSSAVWYSSLTRSHSLAIITNVGPQYAVQPNFRHSPIPLDRDRGDVQKPGGLLHAQTSKEPQFDDAALARIELG